MKIFSFLRKIPAACTCFLLILDAKSALRKLEKPSISPPKRPASPYILFAGRRIAALIESESDTDSKKRLVQAAVKVGGEWSSMSEEEKKVNFPSYHSHILKSTSLPKETMKAGYKSIYPLVLHLMHSWKKKPGL